MIVNFTVDVVRYININVPASANGFYSVSFLPVAPAWGNIYTSSPDECALDLFANTIYQVTVPNTDEIWLHFFTAPSLTLLPQVFVGDANQLTTGIRAPYDQVTDRLDYPFAIVLNGVYEEVQYNYGTDLEDTGGIEVVIHAKSGVSNGLLEIYVRDTYYAYPDEELVAVWAEEREIDIPPDGVQTFTRTGNVNNGLPFNTVSFQLLIPSWMNYFPETILYKIVASDQEIDIEGNRIIPSFDFDVQRELVNVINFAVDVQFNTILIINFNCDILRQLPRTLLIAPTEYNIFEGQSETDGVQSIEIYLSEQQITDSLTYVVVGDVEIMNEVRGQYLDYVFDMRVEQTKKAGILTTCHCCSDIDELLYKQFSMGIPQPPAGVEMTADEVEEWNDKIEQWWEEHFPAEEDRPKFAKASNRMKLSSETLGKQLVMHFDDFYSTIKTESVGYTYSDFIRELFGWTARIPTLMINCYIRNDTIYVIQRGQEQNIVDLTNLKLANLTKSEQIVRTAWGSDRSSYTVTTTEPVYSDVPIPDDSSDDTDDTQAQTEHTYDDSGLVSQTMIIDTLNNTRTTIQYSYIEINNRKFLSQEFTTVVDLTNHEVIQEKTVMHTPLKHGSTGQTFTRAVDEDKETTGTVIDLHPYDERPTPYQKFKYEDGKLKMLTDVRDKQLTINGHATVDTSLPVSDFETKKRFTDAINWLNRKVAQTINVDLYDFNHVIDFNDKILFEGNIFFLESNTVTRTPRIVNKQSLQFVRWY